MKHLFRIFLRKNFPEAAEQLTNEEMDEMSVEFHDYLNRKLTKGQLENILPPDNIFQFILNTNHPLKQNGFEPAYVIHFTDWVKMKQLEEID